MEDSNDIEEIKLSLERAQAEYESLSKGLYKDKQLYAQIQKDLASNILGSQYNDLFSMSKNAKMRNAVDLLKADTIRYKDFIDDLYLNSKYLTDVISTSKILDDYKGKKLTDKEENDLQARIEDLEKQKRMSYLIHRVGDEAKEKLLKDDDFREDFESRDKAYTVVMSLDIRRSTELMLKARDPSLFSEFISNLTEKIIEVIHRNYGIIDKFTGDGLLAFFPEFYSGNDMLYCAIKSATECHRVFNEVYSLSKHCFNVVLKDIGLGIGIDSGEVSLRIINNEYTVVGVPVVYACRLSGADANTTLINQPAYEIVNDKYLEYFELCDDEINIKHEGIISVYRIINVLMEKEIELPKWAVGA